MATCLSIFNNWDFLIILAQNQNILVFLPNFRSNLAQNQNILVFLPNFRSNYFTTITVPE